MHAVAVFEKTSRRQSVEGVINMSQEHAHTPVYVDLHLEGLKPNTEHAIHVHEYGDVRRGCDSACAHFNPYGRMHGRYQYHGPDRHVGDLAIPNGNILSDRQGNANVGFYDDLVSLMPCSERCIVGRMIVVHEKADDGGIFRGEDTTRGRESGKTGNAGRRIACAVIGIARD